MSQAHLISKWFPEHVNEFTAVKWPQAQTPDLSPVEHPWDAIERDIDISTVGSNSVKTVCTQ